VEIQKRSTLVHSDEISNDVDGGKICSAPTSASSLESDKFASAQEYDRPNSRSPEPRIINKLAERQRRKDMVDMFAELKSKLPGRSAKKLSRRQILSNGEISGGR
jgi:hypothetical protein